MNVRLHPSTVWQHDRRNAVKILKAQRARAIREHRHDQADALLMALIDIEATLRDSAAWAIEEAVEMRFVHLH